MPARLISPDRAFNAHMGIATHADSPSKGTITKTEAENALRSLKRASQADKVVIVQDFLSGPAAGALSAKAKEVLTDFIGKTADKPTGASATQVKAAARQETHEARDNITKAQDRLEQLISGNKSQYRSGLQQVGAWLDAAEADVLQAKDQLKKIAKNPAAKEAKKELDAASKDLGKAAADVSSLISAAKGGSVKKADLENLRSWLMAPLPDLNSANQTLIGDHGGTMHTMKAPSDHEDGGSSHGDNLTEKFPSDSEDHGGGAGDGGHVFTTKKFPSDAEDAGGGAGDAGHGGGGIMTTLKYPSDNEDGGGAEPVSTKITGVTEARTDKLKAAFQKANLAGALDWKKGGVVKVSVGVKYVQVKLSKGRTDQYSYTAFIPVGAMNPNAKMKDPNKVNEFYVQRTGGLAGATHTVGPLSVDVRRS